MSTHYLGSLRVTPPLNPEETTWLRAFRRTWRALHPDDPYAVPMNPGAEHEDHPLARRLAGGGWALSTASGRGLARCDWEPLPGGSHIRWVEREKSTMAVVEITYLIDHFLRPGAHAASDGREDFAPFTFDHVVSGVIAAERDDGRLSLIVVEGNEVTEHVLVAGEDDW